MSICIRRALSSRILFSIQQIQSQMRSLSHLSNINSIRSSNESSLCGSGLSSSPIFFVNRRSFAKGKKSKKDDDGDTVQAVPDMGHVKLTARSQMDEAMTALSRELTKLRTGRASPGMLDHIIVEAKGAKTPLSRMAVVSAIDAHTLSVMPYDPTTLNSIERAIVSSPLGLNPRTDGDRLLAEIPPLTKENIQALCKVVAKAAEDVKQSIRRARQKALDSIKKASSLIPKDDLKRLEKEIEEITKESVKSADNMCKAKEKEISGK